MDRTFSLVDTYRPYGLIAHIIRQEDKFLDYLCGYVSVPKDSMLFGMDYRTENIILSNNDMKKLKFSEYNNRFEFYKFANYYVVSPECLFVVHGGVTYSGDLSHIKPYCGNNWYLGFDCAHAFDVFIKDDDANFPGATKKDERYVRNECNKLAFQIRQFYHWEKHSSNKVKRWAVLCLKELKRIFSRN